jgi:3-isopropylmalate dehydrogenase
VSRFDILLAPGDGIGPEVMAEATKVLDKIRSRFGHDFRYRTEAVGAASIDAHGVPIRKETLDIAKDSAAVLFGAVGDPRFDDPQNTVRPEQAILLLRRELGLFANLRPVRVYDELRDGSPIRPERLAGTDMIVVRELTGGLYFGQPKNRWTDEEGRQAVDTLRYSETEVRRVVHVAFRLARQRRRKVTSVDKANVLESGRLWREIATEVGAEYPDVELEHLLVDAAAMYLLSRPSSFDVMVTENTFGDILTDEASMLTGSMGLMPSASLGETREDGTGMGLYEPIHGSAPDIAGQGRANPLAMIMSAAMMLRLSFGLSEEAAAIEAAVDAAIQEGVRTPDIAGTNLGAAVSTIQMGDEIAGRIGA